MLSGVFSLLLLLTQSSKLAAFGALWYAFSANIQWTYSWPSLLPEMIGLFCLVICAVFYLSVGRRPVFLAGAAVVCAAGAVNFALCAYIPHQIPLVWFGVFLCILWLTTRWKSIFRRDYAIPRIAALAAAWGVVGLVMWAFYVDATPALTTMANTLYPGRRSMVSGGYSFLVLSSHFFSFWQSDIRLPLPQIFINICESTGYFWLAPLTLLAIRGVNGEVQKKQVYWFLVGFATLLLVWMTCAIPQALNRAMFLDKTGAGRAIHVHRIGQCRPGGSVPQSQSQRAGNRFARASDAAARSCRICDCLPFIGAAERAARSVSYGAGTGNCRELSDGSGGGRRYKAASLWWPLFLSFLTSLCLAWSTLSIAVSRSSKRLRCFSSSRAVLNFCATAGLSIPRACGTRPSSPRQGATS